jgi:hypothetical protein
MAEYKDQRMESRVPAADESCWSVAEELGVTDAVTVIRITGVVVVDGSGVVFAAVSLVELDDDCESALSDVSGKVLVKVSVEMLVESIVVVLVDVPVVESAGVCVATPSSPQHTEMSSPASQKSVKAELVWQG